MQDNGKYLRLFGTMFFMFIGFLAAIIIILFVLKFFFGLLSYIPGIVHLFTLFIICVPASLFVSVYLIYIKRTKSHPSASAKVFSYIIFSIALCAWAYFFVTDIIIFFRHFYTTVGEYMSYDLFFLSANVFLMFLVGIIQALTVQKEPDWLDRQRDY